MKEGEVWEGETKKGKSNEGFGYSLEIDGVGRGRQAGGGSEFLQCSGRLPYCVCDGPTSMPEQLASSPYRPSD